MATILNPYINFDNKTKEAIEFYQSVFGGKLSLNTYKEGGMPHDPSEENKIMHAMLETDNGMMLMASDVPASSKYTPGNNMAISLSGENESELRGYWDKLSVGGSVIMPLEKAPWGDTFGMLIDKFGIQWMVNINAQQ